MKGTRFIRIKNDDYEKWKSYCQKLEKPSSDLFSRILNSQKLELDKRIEQESKRRPLW